MPFAARSVAFEIAEDKRAWFYCMYLLCITGLVGITVTGDAFNAFVFLEISSLSTYVLIAMGPDRRALVSAFQYLIMGTIGATFYVIGVGLLYTQTGTLNLGLIAERIGDVESTRSILAALAWIKDKLNVLITGPCGVGKSFIASAIAHAACRADYSVRCRGSPAPRSLGGCHAPACSRGSLMRARTRHRNQKSPSTRERGAVQPLGHGRSVVRPAIVPV